MWGDWRLAAALALVFAGCMSTASLQAPTPSGLKYETSVSAAPTTLSLVDARRPDPSFYCSDPVQKRWKVEVDHAPFEPVAFLGGNLQAELASRGLGVKVVTSDAGLPRLRLRLFCMRGVNPHFGLYQTVTFLSADLETAAGAQRIGVFVTRGKVPVWSTDELIDPTVEQPLSIAVKELGAKVANQLYGYRASDATVRELLAKVDGPRRDETFLDVYALGFTNSPAAVQPMLPLTKDPQEYIRLSSISSLGTLRATEQLALLKSIYADPESGWQDRSMAVKSIGDLGTPEARAFLGSLQGQIEPATKRDGFVAQVVALYAND